MTDATPTRPMPADGRAVTAVVVFQAHEGQVAALRLAMQDNATAAAADPGFVSLRLLQEVDDPRTLVYVEQWADRDALMHHLQTPHVASFQRRSAALLAHKEVRILVEPDEGRDSVVHE